MPAYLFFSFRSLHTFVHTNTYRPFYIFIYYKFKCPFLVEQRSHLLFSAINLFSYTLRQRHYIKISFNRHMTPSNIKFNKRHFSGRDLISYDTIQLVKNIITFLHKNPLQIYTTWINNNYLWARTHFKNTDRDSDKSLFFSIHYQIKHKKHMEKFSVALNKYLADKFTHNRN